MGAGRPGGGRIVRWRDPFTVADFAAEAGAVALIVGVGVYQVLRISGCL